MIKLKSIKGGTAMFRNAKVGDKVWSAHKGDTIIIEIKENRCYPILIEGGFSYSYEGKLYLEDEFPSLFWAKPYDKLPEQPKRKVKKQIKAFAVVNKKGIVYQIFHDDGHLQGVEGKIVKLTGEIEIEE